MTVEIPEPNTTTATLTVGTSNPDVDPEKVEGFVHELLQKTEETPSGATITHGTGLFNEEREDNVIVEMWVDSEEELEAVRDMADVLKEEFERYCVCLKLDEVYMEHNHD